MKTGHQFMIKLFLNHNSKYRNEFIEISQKIFILKSNNYIS